MVLILLAFIMLLVLVNFGFTLILFCFYCCTIVFNPTLRFSPYGMRLIKSTCIYLSAHNNIYRKIDHTLTMRVKNDMQHANKNDGGSFMGHRDGSHKTESNKILYRAKYERHA